MAYGAFSKRQDAKSIMNDNHKHPKLKHIHIEPTDNGGAVVEAHHHKPPRRDKEGNSVEAYDTDKSITAHATPEDAANHVSDLLSHHHQHHTKGGAKAFAGKESPAEEKAENMEC